MKFVHKLYVCKSKTVKVSALEWKISRKIQPITLLPMPHHTADKVSSAISEKNGHQLPGCGTVMNLGTGSGYPVLTTNH